MIASDVVSPINWLLVVSSRSIDKREVMIIANIIYLEQTYGPISLGPEDGSDDAPGTRLLSTLKHSGLDLGSSPFSVEIPVLNTHVFVLFIRENGDFDVYPILVDGDCRLSEGEIMKELKGKFRGPLSISRYMLEQPSNSKFVCATMIIISCPPLSKRRS